MVGTIALERHGTSSDTVSLLRSAAIDPARRGHGVGAVLTAAVLRRVDAADALVALLTETATECFSRSDFTLVDRAQLPPAQEESQELRGACPSSARALLRPPTEA
ncbi:hypothetical protein SAMN06272737_10621 [Blastococcus mobilis]|uniref:Acetyltransferase (GNAT) family protein n=2 Tax=Blastococcus mobilis TaxID=1938746 RepID=A0A238W1X8_9ACTN|nr:hypothetical protein SAMN06272737_10621 [Blastococcus mobilis]